MKKFKNLEIYIFIIFLFSGRILFAQLNFEKRVLDTGVNSILMVVTNDLDNDGDFDLVGSSPFDGIFWWEQSDSLNFTRHQIDTTIQQAFQIKSVDMDSDGDFDAIGSTWGLGELAWYENSGTGQFEKHHIDSSSFSTVYAINAFDYGNDGDMDITVCARWHDNHKISINVNHGDQGFNINHIHEGGDCPYAALPIDMDEDGDWDLACCYEYMICWFENENNEFNRSHIINQEVRYPSDIEIADLDNDGDLDVFVVAYVLQGTAVMWFENEGNTPYRYHFIADENYVEQGFDGEVADLNNDGYIDLIAAGMETDFITWWQNNGRGEFHSRIVARDIDGPADVTVIDFDGDGDIDILSGDDDHLYYFENMLFSNEVKSNDNPEFPSAFSLDVFPNPFNNRASVNYSLPETGIVNISLYDINGVQVDELINLKQPVGEYSLMLNAKDHATGMYLLVMNTGEVQLNRKVLLFR